MSKDIYTKREDLICGKLDRLAEIAISWNSITAVDLIASIRNDCERMEAKLAERKNEVEELKEKNRK